MHLFFLNAKVYNKHIVIYRTVSSCYGNWNLGSSRDVLLPLFSEPGEMAFEHLIQVLKVIEKGKAYF